LRLDRVAIGLQLAANNFEPERIYVRFTGAADLKRWAEFMEKQMPGAKTSETKGPKGERILLLASEQTGPAIAFLGDTEVILAGYQKNKANHGELLSRVLDVRAG